MASLVDWDLAAATAKKLGPIGTSDPDVTPAQADAAVAELYSAADKAGAHVADITRLTESALPSAAAITRVVDRAGWVDTNTAGMSAVMTPMVDRLTADKPPGRFAEAVGGRITGAQAGAILAFLSGKVLGQFEFFAVPDGQLMLVAPNIVAVEHALDVDPSDFRLWVCLHEVTHRVQFTAVPWTRAHMLSEVDALTATIDTDPAVLRERLKDAIAAMARSVRGVEAPDDAGAGIMGLLASPEQRDVLNRITAFMSLVEGHAEWVMNTVDESVIPSQKVIERRFAARRRKGGNPLDRFLRKLLGLDAKTRQYIDGAAFVRAVVEQVGIDRFNAVWTGPQTLPTRAEIATPADWVRRVHG